MQIHFPFLKNLKSSPPHPTLQKPNSSHLQHNTCKLVFSRFCCSALGKIDIVSTAVSTNMMFPNLHNDTKIGVIFEAILSDRNYSHSRTIELQHLQRHFSSEEAQTIDAGVPLIIESTLEIRRVFNNQTCTVGVAGNQNVRWTCRGFTRAKPKTPGILVSALNFATLVHDSPDSVLMTCQTIASTSTYDP